MCDDLMPSVFIVKLYSEMCTIDLSNGALILITPIGDRPAALLLLSLAGLFIGGGRAVLERFGGGRGREVERRGLRVLRCRRAGYRRNLDEVRVALAAGGILEDSDG